MILLPKTTVDGTRINYDFSLVTDNQIYCYDTLLIDFVFGAGSADPTYTGHIVLLQMTDASLDTLKIELQNPGTNCAEQRLPGPSRRPPSRSNGDAHF